MRKQWIVILLFFASIAILAPRAQAQCPPDDQSCPWQHYGISFPMGLCRVSVDVDYRICNGILQYKWSNLTKTGDCSFWKDSTILQLVDLMVIQSSMDEANSTLGYTFPFCPTTGIHAEFYSSACYLWVKCTYNTTSDAPICDPPDNPPGPAPNNKVDVWTWHDCGVSCCKRTYEICINATNPLDFRINMENLENISVKILSKVRVIECTDNQAGSVPHWSKTCNDGC